MSQIKNNCMKLLHLIKSKSPFIYIADSDEVNTIKAIQKTVLSLVLNMNKKRGFNIEESFKYLEWSCNTGILNGQISAYKNEGKDSKKTVWKNIINDSEEDKVINFPQNSSGLNEQSRDILEALQNFVTLKPQSSKNENIFIMVIKDPHLHLQNNPPVIRRMREIIMNANKSEAHKNLTRHIIILSPVKKVPVDLEVYVNYIDWKLPDQEDIREFTEDLGELIIVENEDVKEKKIKSSKEELKKCIYTESELKQIVNSLIGLPLCRIEEHLCICYSYKQKVLDHKFLYNLKTKYILENSSLELMDTSVPMNEVGGMDKFKDWIKHRICAFSDEAVSFGIEPPKGVLLVGIQGCGKSLMAKALASLWGLPLVRFDVAKVFSKTIGSSEENIRNTLSTVEALAPCIVMIDEIEKGLAGVASSNFSDSGTTARVVGTLLSWMNDRTSQTFIVATANDISQLPPELLRKGRFDELFFCSLPQKEERKTIFNIHLKKRNQNPESFDCDSFANNTEFYSGAEIEQIVKNALLIAFNEKEKLNNKHVLSSIKEVIPLYSTCKDDINFLLEWVGWDDERKEGLRARFASEEGKQTHGHEGGKMPEFPKKKGVIEFEKNK